MVMRAPFCSRFAIPSKLSFCSGGSHRVQIGRGFGLGGDLRVESTLIRALANRMYLTGLSVL